MKLKISSTLSLPLEAVTQTFAIIAKRGVGKTYAGMVIAEEMLKAGQQVVIADPVGVCWGLRSSADGKAPGFPVIVFGGEHGDVPLEETAGETIAAAIIEHGFPAVLDLSLLRKAAQVRLMTAFAEALYRLNRKPLHFMVDEADAFAPQRPMKGEERLLGAFEDIVRRGRARGLGVTLITQRAAVINKNVLTQTEVLVALRTIAPQDRDAIDAWIEAHGSKHQREVMMQSLASLPIGTAWFWSPGWLDIFQQVKIRERETFDSSSTPEVGQAAAKPKAIAPVDLEVLGDKIKATIERAKENDPSTLKDENRKLRATIKKLESNPAVAVKVESVLTDADRKNLDRAVTLVDGMCASIQVATDKAEQSAKEVKALFDQLIPKLTAFSRRPTQATKKGSAGRTAAPIMRRAPAAPANNGLVGKPEMRVLGVLHQYPDGCTINKIALLSGYRVSGGFRNILTALRTAGYMVGENTGIMQITEEGESRGPFPDLPETGGELIQYWMNSPRLGNPDKRVLQALIEEPNGLDIDQLAERTGYSVSGGFRNILTTLRTANLLVGKNTEKMRAAPEFYE